jgi:hypothetical protein
MGQPRISRSAASRIAEAADDDGVGFGGARSARIIGGTHISRVTLDRQRPSRRFANLDERVGAGPVLRIRRRRSISAEPSRPIDMCPGI